ncbi:MAG: extracellular solute-binding protein [Nocardioidaceae bacterium]
MIPFFAGDEKNYWLDPDGTRTGVPFTWAFLGLTYNTAAVDKLTNWSDLLDPKFKGKIVTIDDPAGQFALGCEINGLTRRPCPKDKLQTVAGRHRTVHSADESVSLRRSVT